MSESDRSIDLEGLSTLLRHLQARLGALPAGVTLTISVGAPPAQSTPVDSPSTPSEDEMRLWYTPKQLADQHAVRPATVQKWVREGRFPGACRLPNGAIRIPKAEADAVLSATKPSAPGPTPPPLGGLSAHVVERSAFPDAVSATPEVKSSSAGSVPNFGGWRRTQQAAR